MQKLRPYLITRPFTVLNDNASLLWLYKYSGTNRRLWNYCMILNDYQITFKFRKGATMGDCDWLSRFALPAKPNDPADPDKDIDSECGTDLVSSTIGGQGMVSVIERRQRQPRVGARNTYHCSKRGSGCTAKTETDRQYHLCPDNKLYCDDCLPKRYARKAKRNVSVREWDKHILHTDEYRKIEHWHNAHWTDDNHNADGRCPHSCACCRSKLGGKAWFGSCPVCNELLYSNARPVWDYEAYLFDDNEVMKRTHVYRDAPEPGNEWDSKTPSRHMKEARQDAYRRTRRHPSDKQKVGVENAFARPAVPSESVVSAGTLNQECLDGFTASDRAYNGQNSTFPAASDPKKCKFDQKSSTQRQSGTLNKKMKAGTKHPTSSASSSQSTDAPACQSLRPGDIPNTTVSMAAPDSKIAKFDVGPKVPTKPVTAVHQATQAKIGRAHV